MLQGASGASGASKFWFIFVAMVVEDDRVLQVKVVKFFTPLIPCVAMVVEDDRVSQEPSISLPAVPTKVLKSRHVGPETALPSCGYPTYKKPSNAHSWPSQASIARLRMNQLNRSSA